MKLDKQMWGLSLRVEQRKKMEQTFFENESSEEARTRYIVAIFLKVLWTLITTVALSGALLYIASVFGWRQSLLSAALGLSAGVAVAAALLLSQQQRVLITILWGLLILPGTAIYASIMAVKSAEAFEAMSAVLTPFIGYAFFTFAGMLIIVKIWQKSPVVEQKAQPEKTAHVPDAAGKAVHKS
jgi:hypothetical protein